MSWVSVKLKDCCEVVGGATPKRDIPKYWASPDFPWITPKDVSNLDGPILEDAPEYISEAGYENSATRMLPKGSVLVTSRAPIGNIAIAGRDMCTNQGFKSLIPGPDVDGLYLYYCMKANSERLKTLGNGATFKEVSKKIVEDFEIPLPPLSEQKRIAAILDKADAIRRKRQQAIHLTNEFLRAVFLDMFGDPVTNLNGWEVKKIGDVCGYIVPGRDKPKSFTGSVPWITTSEISHLGVTLKSAQFMGLTEGEISEVRARVVPKNSVVMTCVGDLGVVSVAGEDMVVNQQLHAFLPSESVVPAFIMYALSFQKDYMIKMASNTTVPYMNKTVCNSVPVILPAYSLQKKFGELVVRVMGVKAAFTKFSGEPMFEALSKKAFSGQL
ncbi:restriction endonuclease subunit S [Pseudomonas shahriarae]|uniref:restriction endonuclease subunit S n=1 Tax=Pseudomonas shahriarae TaxID=2745512 RepID=UPI002499D987|nr:restriction endonuclease subunit S [Pseudomonas shahriarae]MDI3202953.1 restriction endonuclease subunit S [Pseudomonas shahriarae]